MRILVVNVNTTDSITQAIARQAQAVAAPGTEIIGLTPAFGAESVEGNFESYLAAIAVMDCVMSYDRPFDAVIQAGYGEHGREGLQELLNVPVVDITDAAASTAMFLGRAYSVVTTLDRTVPLIEDRLTEGRGTSIFGRSAGLPGATAALTTGRVMTGSAGGSGSTSSSGREGAANGSSVRGNQLTTCMAVKKARRRDSFNKGRPSVDN